MMRLIRRNVLATTSIDNDSTAESSETVSIDKVREAVIREWISETEFTEITNEPY